MHYQNGDQQTLGDMQDKVNLIVLRCRPLVFSKRLGRYDRERQIKALLEAKADADNAIIDFVNRVRAEHTDER